MDKEIIEDFNSYYCVNATEADIENLLKSQVIDYALAWNGIQVLRGCVRQLPTTKVVGL